MSILLSNACLFALEFPNVIEDPRKLTNVRRNCLQKRTHTEKNTYPFGKANMTVYKARDGSPLSGTRTSSLNPEVSTTLTEK